MRENTDKNNSEYGHFLRLYIAPFSDGYIRESIRFKLSNKNEMKVIAHNEAISFVIRVYATALHLTLVS